MIHPTNETVAAGNLSLFPMSSGKAISSNWPCFFKLALSKIVELRILNLQTKAGDWICFFQYNID